MNAGDLRDIIVDAVQALFEHNHAPPYVAIIPQQYHAPLEGVVIMNTDYGAVEIVKRTEVGPDLIYVMTKADYLEKYG